MNLIRMYLQLNETRDNDKPFARPGFEPTPEAVQLWLAGNWRRRAESRRNLRRLIMRRAAR